MKLLIQLVFVFLILIGAHGATPSFQSFAPVWFNTNGNIITIDNTNNTFYFTTLINSTLSNSTLTGTTTIVGPTNIALSSYLVNGLESSNAAARGGSVPGWQSQAEPLPWRGNVAGAETDATNFIGFYRTAGIKSFNVIWTFQQMFKTNRIGGHLVIDSNNFPSGIEGYKSLLHTNGQRWGQWYDRTSATSEGQAGVAQFIDDIQTILSWKPDLFWVDQEGYFAWLAAMIVATNQWRPQMLYGVDAANPDAFAIEYGSGFRLHVSQDPTTWNVLVETMNVVHSNKIYQYDGPFFIGPEANGLGTSTEIATATAVQAMWGNNFMLGFNASVGPRTTLTNQYILEAQKDGICARTIGFTNGLVYLLKPLGSLSGPNFDLMIVNTNATTTNYGALNLSWVNQGLQPSLFSLTAASYSIYDLKTNGLVGAGMTTLPSGTVASHDYAFFKLVPVSANGPLTIYYTPDMLGVATSVWARITHEGFFGPFGPSDYFARDGIRCSTATGTFVYYPVPEWATIATVSYLVGCNTNSTWTNQVSANYFNAATGPAADIGAVAINVPIFATNGVQQVEYTVGLTATPNNKVPHWMIESWPAATNAANPGTRMILGNVKVTFE